LHGGRCEAWFTWSVMRMIAIGSMDWRGQCVSSSFYGEKQETCQVETKARATLSLLATLSGRHNQHKKSTIRFDFRFVFIFWVLFFARFEYSIISIEIPMVNMCNGSISEDYYSKYEVGATNTRNHYFCRSCRKSIKRALAQVRSDRKRGAKRKKTAKSAGILLSETLVVSRILKTNGPTSSKVFNALHEGFRCRPGTKEPFRFLAKNPRIETTLGF
jgi:hypothetical protein